MEMQRKNHVQVHEIFKVNMGVEPKILGKPTKMNGLYILEKPMNKWMIWGVLHPPLFLGGNTHMENIQWSKQV